MKILIVEPDKILAVAMAASLKAAGHTVTVRRTAQTALDHLDDSLGNEPDMIVLEIQLGLHNGIEFLYEIRSYPEWQGIPVIVHTINKRVLASEFIEPFKELAVQAVLYKPQTNLQQLVQAAQQQTVPSS